MKILLVLLFIGVITGHFVVVYATRPVSKQIVSLEVSKGYKAAIKQSEKSVLIVILKEDVR